MWGELFAVELGRSPEAEQRAERLVGLASLAGFEAAVDAGRMAPAVEDPLAELFDIRDERLRALKGDAFDVAELPRMGEEFGPLGEMSREEWINSPGCELVAADLKKTLEGLCDAIFGPVEKVASPPQAPTRSTSPCPARGPIPLPPS